MVRLLAYRLYLSAQVVVTACAAVLIVGWSISELHDRHVANVDFACFDRSGWGPPTAEELRAAGIGEAGQQFDPDKYLAEKREVSEKVLSPEGQRAAKVLAGPEPGVASVGLEATAATCHIADQTYSTRAWRGRITGGRARGYEEDAILLAFAVLAPLALFGMYRWLKWLVRPPPSRS